MGRIKVMLQIHDAQNMTKNQTNHEMSPTKLAKENDYIVARRDVIE
jgi:hypothetical protein